MQGWVESQSDRSHPSPPQTPQGVGGDYFHLFTAKRIRAVSRSNSSMRVCPPGFHTRSRHPTLRQHARLRGPVDHGVGALSFLHLEAGSSRGGAWRSKVTRRCRCGCYIWPIPRPTAPTRSSASLPPASSPPSNGLASIAIPAGRRQLGRVCRWRLSAAGPPRLCIACYRRRISAATPVFIGRDGWAPTATGAPTKWRCATSWRKWRSRALLFRRDATSHGSSIDDVDGEKEEGDVEIYCWKRSLKQHTNSNKQYIF